MNHLSTILAMLASLATIFGGLVLWVRTTSEERQKLKQTLISLFSNSVKTLAILLALGAGLLNCWEIYQFGQLDSAPTRVEILVLLMTLWNAVFYSLSALLVAGLWLKQMQDKKYPTHSLT